MIDRFKEDTLTDSKGRSVSVMQPLIQRGVVPRQGWGVKVVINGVSIPVSGQSPLYVIEALRDILERNNIEYQEKDLWATTNVTWMRNVGTKYHLVDYFKVIDNIAPAEDTSYRGSTPTSEWFPSMIDTLGHVLAGDADSFTPDRFKITALTLLNAGFTTHSFKTGTPALEIALAYSYTHLRNLTSRTIQPYRNWFCVLVQRVVEAGLIERPTHPNKIQELYNW